MWTFVLSRPSFTSLYHIIVEILTSGLSYTFGKNYLYQKPFPRKFGRHHSRRIFLICRNFREKSFWSKLFFSNEYDTQVNISSCTSQCCRQIVEVTVWRISWAAKLGRLFSFYFCLSFVEKINNILYYILFSVGFVVKWLVVSIVPKPATTENAPLLLYLSVSIIWGKSLIDRWVDGYLKSRKSGFLWLAVKYYVPPSWEYRRGRCWNEKYKIQTWRFKWRLNFDTHTHTSWALS